MTENKKTLSIQVLYFSLLRETTHQNKEIIETNAKNPLDLYQKLNSQYNFPIEQNSLRVAINNSFVDWQTPLQKDDEVAFIPPISGG